LNREIGSEFWLDKIPKESNSELPTWLNNLRDTILTSSGRGAISLLLDQVNPKYKTVLLPAFICDSVILPFIEHGYSYNFYEINEDFSPNIEDINSYENIGIFLHLGYFGFQTNSNLLRVLKRLKEQSTIVIEDITHTLFSTFNRFEYNDYYIGSIRKWFGVPTGGFISSLKSKLKSPLLTNVGFSELRTAALLSKGKYIETGDVSFKKIFLNQFSNAETLLDKDVTSYCIENISIELIKLIDVNELVSKRRNNFEFLSEGLKNVSYLASPFDDLENDVCPMFYPILIKNRRDELRGKLTEEKIYCPIHWPIAEQIKDKNLESTMGIYNTILSIPCDQRYGMHEMERIISVLKSV